LAIPLDTKVGKWKFVKVVFKANSGGLDKDLTPSGDLTFDVIPHDPLVVPSDAKVEIN
jgi:hypothetical protein